jgi:hypothetical protein
MVLLAIGLLCAAPGSGAAQTAPAQDSPPSTATSAIPRPEADQVAPPRACAGCPERHLWRPYLESIGLNVLYNMGNRLRGHETARIGPSSWYANMKHGFEWDNNPFGVNQFGHPYQGSNYFTAGRANGLSFWESTAVAAFGSAAWEFYFENNRASLNDLINTTLGGIELGEVLHRTAWLVRNTTTTGKRRMTQEIVATVIDPLTGATRFITGDASRVVEKPPAMVPSSLGLRTSVGGVWQGSNIRSATATSRPFLDVEVQYGDIRTGSTRVPYEAFTLEATVGGGSALSEAVARGRFYGKPFGANGQYQFTVLQTFDYVVNRAYAFGGQGFEAEAALTHWTSRSAVRLAASGGVSALAAVDSLIPPPPEAGDPEEAFADPDSRRYDYGPGFRIAGSGSLSLDQQLAATLSYYLYHVAVVDGFRSNHVLQRAYLDVRWLRPRRIGLGVAAEYFWRKAYFWVGSERSDQSPQFRAYLVWATS